jgi:hypothetical protein
MVRDSFCFLKSQHKDGFKKRRIQLRRAENTAILCLAVRAGTRFWQSFGNLCAWVGLTWPSPFKNI